MSAGTGDPHFPSEGAIEDAYDPVLFLADFEARLVRALELEDERDQRGRGIAGLDVPCPGHRLNLAPRLEATSGSGVPFDDLRGGQFRPRATLSPKDRQTVPPGVDLAPCATLRRIRPAAG